MAAHFSDRDATVEVDGEAPSHEVVQLWRHADARGREATDFGGLGVREWYLARDEDREEDPERPNLARRRFVELSAKDFGRRERGRAVEA